jgi:hypothetical protein
LGSWCWRDDAGLARALGFEWAPPFEPGVDYGATAYLGSYNLVQLNSLARSRDQLYVSLGRVAPGSKSALRRQLARDRLARRLAASPLARPVFRAMGSRAARRAAAGLRRRPAPAPQRLAHAPSAFSALVALRDGEAPGGGELLARIDAARVPNHNLIPVGELLLYCDSNVGALAAWDRAVAAPAGRIDIRARSRFARGLARVDDDLYLVGTPHPMELHALSLEAGRVLWSVPLGGSPFETPFAIAPIPDAFDDPPPRWPG